MMMSYFAVAIALVLATPTEAFSLARHARPTTALKMSAESRLLQVVADTRLLSRIADSGLIKTAEKSGVTLASLESIIGTADEKGLVDVAIKLIESPLAQPVVEFLGGQSPFRGGNRISVPLSAEDKKSVLLKKISEKKIASLIARRGLLAKADAAGLKLSDVTPLLKTADELELVDVLADNIDTFGPLVVQFLPRALPLVSTVLESFSFARSKPFGGKGSTSPLQSIALPSAPALPSGPILGVVTLPSASSKVLRIGLPSSNKDLVDAKAPAKKAVVKAKAPAKKAVVKAKAPAKKPVVKAKAPVKKAVVKAKAPAKRR